MLALDCEWASASGGASQDLRLKGKVVDVPTDGFTHCKPREYVSELVMAKTI